MTQTCKHNGIFGIVVEHETKVEAYGRTWDAGNGKIREIREFDSRTEAEDRAARLRKQFPDTTYTVHPMTQIHSVLAEKRLQARYQVSTSGRTRTLGE